MYLKLSNIIEKNNYIDMNDRLMIKLSDVYYELLTYYSICDYYSLIGFISQNYFITYLSLKYVKENDIQPRNFIFEEKLNKYFDYYSNSLKRVYDLGILSISDFVESNYEKHVLNCENFYLDPMTKEDYSNKLDYQLKLILGMVSFTEEYLDCSKDVYLAVNEFIEIANEFATRSTGLQNKNTYLKEVFSDEMELNPFSLDNLDISKFVICEPDEEFNCDLTYFKGFLGEKYGNQIYGIYSHCIKNNKYIAPSSNVFDFNNDNLCYELYVLKKVMKVLSMLSCICDLETLEWYILKGLDKLQDCPISDLVYCNKIMFNSKINILDLFKNVINSMLKAISFRVLIECNDDCKIKWYEFLMNFTRVNSIIGKVNIPFYKLSGEAIDKIGRENFGLFVEYFCNRLDFDNITFMQNNRNIIEACNDIELLNKLKNQLKNIIFYNEESINYIFMDLPHQKLRGLIKQLNIENRDFALDIPYDNMELFKTIYNIKKNILDVGKKNKTLKDIIKLINESVADKILAGEDVTDFNTIVEMYEKYNTLYVESEYIKERIFYVEYKDNLENAIATAEQFKKDFYNKIKYKKNDYYDMFKKRLLEDVSLEQRDLYFKKWTQIISKFQEAEIIDAVSTNEYVYKMLINQDMELTPLLVCYLKATEQFLCAYIHYMSGKGLTPFNKVLPDDWENKLGMGLFLEEHIKNNIHIPHKSTVGDILFTDWCTTSTYWRTKARNGNLHKENVNKKSDLEDFIKGCIKLIRLTLEISLKFDKNK